MTKRSFLLLAAVCFFAFGARCQENKARPEPVEVVKLVSYTQDFPIEKAYLQFDKPYYAAGDTIYFKAYVTVGEQHKLSGISGVLHVDLINTKNKIDQSIKLQLNGGISWGDFALPDSLPAGNYRIRAYTRWMRNDGENDFFEKLIPVASVKPARVPESVVKQPALALKPDVQFLPEGGTLITGIKTKVAFKAIGPNGLGIEAKGVVIDNDNQTVASIASAHLGMGSFTFTPVEGKTYSAKITYPNGLQDLIPLPKAEPDGISLSVNNDSLPEAKVSITANPAFFNRNKGKDYTLLISSGGLITSVDCPLDSPVIKLDILKRKLRTGVATVTLFSPANEPLCERLFFVQNYDRLDLSISSDKSVYAAREKVNITLNALNRKDEAAEGHFSVAVVNERLVPDSGHKAGNILTYLLLTSDLKGYVEQPDDYFADTSATANKNLDLLMLTQGYRRFEWKQVLDTAKRALAYQPESSLTIAGRVDNLANKPIANGAINLIPAKGGGLLSTSTDGKGLFRFPNLFFIDTARFVLNAMNDKGKKYTKITYFNDAKNAPVVPPIPATMSLKMNDSTLSAYADSDKEELKEVSTYINRKPIMLKQVNIHRKKPDNQYRTESLAGAGNADQVVHADEISRIDGPLVTSLNGRLHGVIFKGGRHKVPYLTFGTGPMYVIIDGQEGADINQLIAEEVETVEVLKYASASMYGVAGGNGVLVITTKRTRQPDAKDIPSIGVLPLTLTGFYKARQFYSPKYNTPAALNSKQRDLRSTIYWKPEIKTDKDGNAGFDFYNADGAGTYKITVEGIDKDGNIGRRVYRYEVK
jgi:TonB-dependent SusC/RagA subfamily outer membrane receptor